MKNKENLSKLALSLIAHRKSMRLTQNQVAEALGIKRSTYAYYERDTMPSLEIIEKLAKIYGVTQGKLMFPNEENYSVSVTFGDQKSFQTPKIEFATLNNKEKDMLIKIRLLSEVQKEELQEKIDSMIAKEE